MCWDIPRKLKDWWTRCLYEATSKHKVELREIQRRWLEGERCWEHRLIKAWGYVLGKQESWYTMYRETVKVSESLWLTWPMQGERGSSRRTDKEGRGKWSGRLRGGFCSSAMDRLCRNRISSAQARKRRQPQSWRHRGKSACKRVQEAEVKIYRLFSI